MSPGSTSTAASAAPAAAAASPDAMLDPDAIAARLSGPGPPGPRRLERGAVAAPLGGNLLIRFPAGRPRSEKLGLHTPRGIFETRSRQSRPRGQHAARGPAPAPQRRGKRHPSPRRGVPPGRRLGYPCDKPRIQMPRFAANLTFLFKDYPFLDRFAEAKAAGFDAVEILFPYDDPVGELTEPDADAGPAAGADQHPAAELDRRRARLCRRAGQRGPVPPGFPAARCASPTG